MPATDGLRRNLESLPLRIDALEVESGDVEVESYPGARRPSSTVLLRGGDSKGCGEHVGWTADEHARFAEAASRLSLRASKVGDWSRSLATLPTYDRAALEAAAIDLALKQADTSLLGFAGIEARPVRYVVSFERAADPVAAASRITPASLGLKIDCDPDWTDEVWAALARLGRVAVVDFKRTGTAADHERAHRHLPEAWIEDPDPQASGWSATLRARISADAAVVSAAAIAALEPAPGAVNVKPARIGGVLEAIDCLVHCARAKLPVYIGGMFECGVGRSQLVTLAALACPDAPNDIAPLVGELARRRPPRLDVDGQRAGFGALR